MMCYIAFGSKVLLLKQWVLVEYLRWRETTQSLGVVLCSTAVVKAIRELLMFHDVVVHTHRCCNYIILF